MRIDKKTIFYFLTFEVVVLAAILPTYGFNLMFSNGIYRWIAGYMLFVLAVTGAVCLKKPPAFFTVWLICSIANFAFEKSSLLILAPVSVGLWVFLNVAEPLNRGDFNDRHNLNKAAAVNIVWLAVMLALFIAGIIFAAKSSINIAGVKFYRIPWAGLLVYYIYSLVFKSKIPAFIKLKTKLKKLC